MKIVTVQFNYPDRPNYAILLEVFKYSVKKYMPKVDFVEFKTAPPPRAELSQPLNFSYNDFKLRIWRDVMEKAKEPIVFADCDMMMVQPCLHAFNINFDVAATFRTVTNRIPMNGGIVFARPTEPARRFFREWYKINNKMLHDIRFHHEWRRRWAGMNQSAFGYIYERGKHGARVHKYFTREWNAVDCDWSHLDKKTVFIHYKSKLRKLILANIEPHGIYKKAMELWYAMLCEIKRGGIEYKKHKPNPRRRHKRYSNVHRRRRTA